MDRAPQRARFLNLGCGFHKLDSSPEVEWINVDAFANCKPDVVHDLNKFPFPWPDSSIDGILAKHVMEHLVDWWGAFLECVRVTKIGGTIEVRVPHPSSDSALAYRDHLHVISLMSFDGVKGGPERTTNAWFENQDKVPVRLESYFLVPWTKYQKFPQWLLAFCADHLRNFIWEQRFVFRKIGNSR